MKALLIIDLQNDFITGSLKVKDGAKVVPICNQLMVDGGFDTIVLTQDWHPMNHSSFASSNEEKKGWPDHCLMGTKGAEFHKDLLTGKAHLIIRKGYNKNADAYSAFEDENGVESGLSGMLKDRDIKEVYLAGLALDVCVKQNALDAKIDLFDVYVVEDACKAVGNGKEAIEEMKKSGIKFVKYESLTKKSKK